MRFQIASGHTKNYFLRDREIATHWLTTAADAPRLIVAFPAGNSGALVRFSGRASALELEGPAFLEPVREASALRGATAVVTSDSRLLVFEHVLLGSVRLLRRMTEEGVATPEAAPEIDVGKGRAVFVRRLFDGKRLQLRVEALEDTVLVYDPGLRTLSATSEEQGIRLRVTALTDEPPLTPIIWTASHDPLEQALQFLSFEEALLAGSWRFLGPFARDELITARLFVEGLSSKGRVTPRIARVLPVLIEAALRAAFDRMNAQGELAHEEDVGDYAGFRRRTERGEASCAPIYDYKMVDDEFLLAPLVYEYFLRTEVGKKRAVSFFSRRSPSGVLYRDLLLRNLTFVARVAEPFARRPVASNLIGLKAGHAVGNWRDSEDGLGGGVYPYDVNAVLVPAALEAGAALRRSELFDASRVASAEMSRIARAWRVSAPALFRVRIDARTAGLQIAAYRQSIGLASGPSLPPSPVGFPAIALDDHGRVVPVMHSDEGFLLLYGTPTERELVEVARRATDPFPGGLLSGAGMLVANPVYAPQWQKRFTAAHYHGTVVWSWQQAMMAAGLTRQLRRTDLSAEARRDVRRASSAMWTSIAKARGEGAAELWSWVMVEGQMRRAAFGDQRGDRSESNAVQLWSTVYLALAPP